MYNNIDKKGERQEQTMDSKIQEEDRLTDLYNSVCVGDERMTIQLIKTRPHLINRPCINWKQGGYELPIAAAVRLKQNDIAYLLLSHGSHMETQEPAEGITALQWAAAYGNVVLLEVLLKNGADINHQSTNNNTALHYAVLYGEMDSVICLLENEAEEVMNDFHLMPIHLACLHSVIPIVKQFLKLIKSPEDLLSVEYVQAFSIACVNGRIEVAKMWLNYFEINYTDYHVKTKEFLELVNFFSILKEWVDMFDGEEVGEEDNDFDENYWRHQQILKLFLSHDIQWACPKTLTGTDDDYILNLFCHHPCSVLLNSFLIHCPLTNLTHPSTTLLNQAIKHIINNKSLTEVFRSFRFNIPSLHTENILPTNTHSSNLNNNPSTTSLHVNGSQIITQHPTTINNHTIVSNPEGINNIDIINDPSDEILTINPLLSLQESCRRVIRCCLAGPLITNISFKMLHLHLPPSMETFLIFS